MKRILPRRRTLWLIGGSLAVLGYSIATDPNGGSLTAALAGNMAMPIWAVWFAYLAVKALFDYIDGEEVFFKARQTATGAGLVFLGRAVVIAALLGLFGNQLHAEPINASTYVPVPAKTYLPELKKVQTEYWPDHPKANCSQV